MVDISAALAAWSGSASELLGIVHGAARNADRAGHDWRDVVNGLRPLTSLLWKSMPAREKARFLRHARPFWDIHRHRAPEEVVSVIERLRSSGQLTIRAGRIRYFEADRDQVEDVLLCQM